MSTLRPLDTPDALFFSLQQALEGRYSLDRELGRGGMGIVYLAREVRLDRPVAIKVLPPTVAVDTLTRERFALEARTAARLAHPHIIPIHAVDIVDDHVFYVMGFVDGQSLAQRVAERGPLSAREGARLLQEVAWALAHAHAQGIVHRDIKPDNILIERDSGRAIVADFGIAAAIGTNADGVFGTPAFMSPEQVVGDELDARSDLYAVGATAFFAFAGRAPFEGTDLMMLAKHMSEPPPSLASLGVSLPRYLVQLVAQCLAKSPADRPRDAQQVADLLGKGIVSRRDLPAALRAFVKRDGRTDGVVTPGVVVGAAVAGALTAGTLGLFGFIGVTCALLFVAASTFLVRSARRLLRGGYTHADVTAAFKAEVESLLEERRLVVRPVLAWLTRIVEVGLRGSVGAGALICLAAMIGGDEFVSVSVMELTITVIVIACCLVVLWVVTVAAQRDDTLFWRSLWSGRVGQWSFALAQRLGGRAQRPATMTHRATELSLSLAAESLFDALPHKVRKSLRAVPRILQQLHDAALALRARSERLEELLVASMSGENVQAVYAEQELVAQQLQNTVVALERIRLDLLRLHAGVGSAEGVTSSLLRAESISRHIQRHLDARREVDDMIATGRVSHMTQMAPSAIEPNREWA